MSNWREWFNDRSGPGVLAGVTPWGWLGLLSDNGFRVSPSYLARFASITWSSLSQCPSVGFEAMCYGRAIRAAAVPAPLFVLGHWRSGTTLLHDLLAVDDRFASPTLYQVIYPHTFLTTETLASPLLRWFMPKNRPQDNMKLDPSAVWEDEFAMCAWGLVSPYLAWAFPRRAAHYDRFHTFADATPEELRRWRDSFLAFLRKLTVKHRKPLILKSPTHTARVRLLLELFPGAKFVHIHRNPYDVFSSCRHLYAKAMPAMRLQPTDGIDWDERIVRLYKEMHAAFFAERGLIPPGQYHEVCYEELEKDPLGQVRQLYESLGLPDFAHAEPRLKAYVDSIRGYRKNAYEELPDEWRRRLAGEWSQCFEEWGYLR